MNIGCVLCYVCVCVCIVVCVGNVWQVVVAKCWQCSRFVSFNFSNLQRRFCSPARRPDEPLKQKWSDSVATFSRIKTQQGKQPKHPLHEDEQGDEGGGEVGRWFAWELSLSSSNIADCLLAPPLIAIHMPRLPCCRLIFNDQWSRLDLMLQGERGGAAELGWQRSASAGSACVVEKSRAL